MDNSISRPCIAMYLNEEDKIRIDCATSEEACSLINKLNQSGPIRGLAFCINVEVPIDQKTLEQIEDAIEFLIKRKNRI
jgi:hypothetical protein